MAATKTAHVQTVGALQAAAFQALHKDALPDDITPNLPAPYYRTILEMMAEPDNGFLLQVEDGGRPVGLCGVVYCANDFAAKISAQRAALVRSVIKFAFTRPPLLLDMAGSMFGKTSYHREVHPSPEMFFICVAGDAQSRGVGAQMLNEAFHRVVAEGRPGMLVKTASDRAHQFYLRNGFVEVGIQDRGRRKLGILHRGRAKSDL